MPAFSANALRRWTTVHRWTSLFCTLNLTLLAITGLILIFRHEIDDALGTVPEMKTTSGQVLPLGQLVDAALKAKPGWSPMTYAEDDDHPASVTTASESPWYIKALFVSGPLHYGDYAGMPLKIIWALFTLLTLFLCVSGIYLWIARLRSRRTSAAEPAPLIEEQVS